MDYRPLLPSAPRPRTAVGLEERRARAVQTAVLLLVGAACVLAPPGLLGAALWAGLDGNGDLADTCFDASLASLVVLPPLGLAVALLFRRRLEACLFTALLVVGAALFHRYPARERLPQPMIDAWSTRPPSPATA